MEDLKQKRAELVTVLKLAYMKEINAMSAILRGLEAKKRAGAKTVMQLICEYARWRVER